MGTELVGNRTWNEAGLGLNVGTQFPGNSSWSAAGGRQGRMVARSPDARALAVETSWPVEAQPSGPVRRGRVRAGSPAPGGRGFGAF